MTERQDIAFEAEGTTLRGWLFRPEGAGDEPLPCVVMAHGFGAVKEQFLDRFAERFAEAGLSVLVYDHRRFGASDGTPRNDIDPWTQVDDYRQAISYARSRPDVDGERIGVWGTSFSGGHVLVVGATDPRVRCVVSQVPTISGYAAFTRRVAPDQVAAIERALAAEWERISAGDAPRVRPLVDDGSGRDPIYASTDAQAFFQTPGAWPDTWDNEATVRSLGRSRDYEPVMFIERIAPTPLLMIVGDADTVTLTDLQLAAFNRAREPKRLVLVPGDHWEPYARSFEPASAAARAFLAEHLLGADGTLTPAPTPAMRAG